MNIVIRLCFISLIVVQLIKGNYDPVASRNISMLCQLGARISIKLIYGYDI